MEIIYKRCCGLDVHQATVVACVRLPGKGRRRRTSEVQTFETTTAALLQLADWLTEQGVTHVAMESTGVYWKPVFNILEGSFTVILVNAQHYRTVPGRKTDAKDCAWLAELLELGLLRASFIPPRPIRELRELTRYRKTLVQERTREVNRVHKLLESANPSWGWSQRTSWGRRGGRFCARWWPASATGPCWPSWPKAFCGTSTPGWPPP
jgi:transposase